MKCNQLLECAKKEFAKETIENCTNHNHKECIESSDNRSNVSCVERKKKYILKNTKKIHIISYKMDGGIIVLDKNVPEKICKCDYLFLVESLKKSAILIELKGVNVLHAIKQIEGTLKTFKDFFETFYHIYVRIVVTSSVPNLKATPDYVNLSKKIRHSFSGNIKIKEKEFLEKDTDLDMM